MIQVLQSLKEETLAALNEKLQKYLPILIGKPAYTTAEADLWFEFMNECFQTQFLSTLALQTICEEMVSGTGNDGYGGMPDRYLFIPQKGSEGFVFGYTDRYSAFGNVLTWENILYAIDTIEWSAIIKDKNTKAHFKVPLSWLSNEYLISIIATLRTITKETRQISNTIL